MGSGRLRSSSLGSGRVGSGLVGGAPQDLAVSAMVWEDLDHGAANPSANDSGESEKRKKYHRLRGHTLF